MSLVAVPENPSSTYVHRTFTSTHTLYNWTGFGYSSISVTLSSWSIKVATTSYLNVVIVGSSTLIISGYYVDCFTDQYFEFRTADSSLSVSSVTAYENLPDTFWLATKFKPDLNTTTSVGITIVTDQGTLNMVQTVYNDWNWERNRFIGFIRRGDLDATTSTARYIQDQLDDLPD